MMKKIFEIKISKKIKNMKYTTTIITLLLAAASLSAQNHQPDMNMYRAGDEIIKMQVAYKGHGQKGEQIQWDFSDMDVLNDRYIVSYSETPGENEHAVTGTERRTLYYYENHGDSLLMLGYENNTTKMKYDRPKALLRFPIKYGIRTAGLFHGSGAYSERLMIRVYGDYTTETDATGTLLLPEGETLHNVKRVHIKTTTGWRYLPDITTEKQLHIYTDSICNFNTDSITKHLQNDSLLIETDTYQWYAPGYRYPIFETTTSGKRGGTAQFLASWYCPTQEQKHLYDETNRELRDSLDNNGKKNNLTENNKTEERDAPEYEMSVKNGTVNITYDATQNTNIKILICDIYGIVYKESETYCNAGERTSMSVDCKGLRHGEYVIYINAEGNISSRKIKL